MKSKIEIMEKKNRYTKPDEMGFYGDFGGAFIPELLRQNIEELKENFERIATDFDFQN